MAYMDVVEKGVTFLGPPGSCHSNDHHRVSVKLKKDERRDVTSFYIARNFGGK